MVRDALLRNAPHHEAEKAQRLCDGAPPTPVIPAKAGIQHLLRWAKGVERCLYRCLLAFCSSNFKL